MSNSYQGLGGAKLPAWKGIGAIFLPSMVVFVCLDMVWIGLIASQMYSQELADLPKATPPRVWAALASWICIVAAVYLFVLPAIPAVKPGQHEYVSALCTGAAMGLVLYGTVDFTNHAVIKDWSLLVTVVDLMWGTVACATLAVVQIALRGLWI